MKFKKILVLVLSVIMIMMLMACSSKPSPIGKWYNKNGRCLDIRSDGTYKLENDYGTGTWKYLDDGVTIEFTDFYGDTQESEINTASNGQYIDFGYYGDFYLNEYPTETTNNDAIENNTTTDF